MARNIFGMDLRRRMENAVPDQMELNIIEEYLAQHNAIECNTI
jgi:hypothetical protein